MKRLIYFIVLLSAMRNTDGALYCQQRPNFQELDRYINFKMERDHIPGLAVIIVRGDEIAYSKGFGYQNTERRVPMTVRSTFDVASISKLVTAIAVMQLAERGQISLEEPVNKHLPFRIRHPDHPDAEMTIAQLLGHTASTSNGPSLWRCYSCESQALTLRDWVAAYFLPEGRHYHREGNFCRWKPGEGFLYSNSGYALLAYLVESVSKKPFDRYCKENIFNPLSMRTTSFEVADVAGPNLATMYAYGYAMDLERDLMEPSADFGKIAVGDYLFPLCHYTIPTIGAAGLYTNAEELTHLLVALMRGGVCNGKRVLTRESVTKMLSPFVSPQQMPSFFAAFGLGAYAFRLNNGEPVWGHTGADPGTSTFMLFNADANIGAIVLANRFVDIRDLIEWCFAEGVTRCSAHQLFQSKPSWKDFSPHQKKQKVVLRVVPNYLPGGSRVYVIGNHHYLGKWVSTGIPLSPQKDRSWTKEFFFPESTRIEFKITRGSMSTQAATAEGKICPNNLFLVERDTVVTVAVEDWADQVQD